MIKDERGTCKEMTVCRKAAIFATAFTQIGPLTLLRRYDDVEVP